MPDTITILCGGQSRRMGQDKALLQYNGETLLARHIRLAEIEGLRVQVASAGKDYDLPANIIRVHDKLPDQAGPLSALAGALTAATLIGAQGTWLMPVDTLVSPLELIATLRDKLPASSVIAVRDGKPQPLFAWYSCTLLPRIESWLDSGIRQMMPLAAISDIRHVVMPDDWIGRDNFNTLEDWQTAQHIQETTS